MQIDLRQIAFATLWKKYEKKINTEEAKKAIRNGEATYKFADYCNVALSNYTQPASYAPEVQAKIDEFIKENGFEKIPGETVENYKVEFIPSEKAIKEFKKMLLELESSQFRNIAKVASKVRIK